MVNQSWNSLKFQIYWNKLKWVNPRSHDEGNNPFCVSSKKFCLKDNNKTEHWVGHSKLKPMYIEYCFKIKNIINELEASLTVATIKQSNYGTENNTYFLQEDEVENPDSYVTADAGQINECNDNMNI